MNGLGSLISANIPVLILMLVGVGLLVFEMYVPGFGVPGISGIALLVLAVALIAAGVFNGSARDVFGKAVKICTECVGLG